ncbi:FecR family protein [Pedobacter miscanthi]|uniref:Anti-sigma factor n=1 Tax=Pedobacter miscanthi TaxID=2259170 RepID=A0A366L3P3_9SPHI|nr:FecR domain-containing protein [Pedobacter miscanthi]RBQ07924.1 anti-sigma factor [Pedobacter miscanthi]
MNNAKNLLEKYKAGQCSGEEILILQNWFHQLNAEENLELGDEEFENAETEMWKVIAAETQVTKETKVYRMRFGYWAAAAALLIVLGGLFFYKMRLQQHSVDSLASSNIKPGVQTATLTLSNGKKIVLTGTSDHSAISEHGVSISRTADGKLMYRITENTADTGVYNTLSTAKGQQYSVVLPDGSLVHLNAGSSITYSTGLNHTARRKIKLEGEAYFEVAKNRQHPFEVLTGQQMVEVLGTHFNINSYSDEPATKTTLLEGSVKVFSLGNQGVDHHKILVPGEQAILSKGTISVEKVNAEEAIYWKDNKFSFHSEDIETVMREVSRWYNVTVTYQDDVKHVKVSGSVSRFADISMLLDKLEKTGLLKFTIKGRNITVSKT